MQIHISCNNYNLILVGLQMFNTAGQNVINCVSVYRTDVSGQKNYVCGIWAVIVGSLVLDLITDRRPTRAKCPWMATLCRNVFTWCGIY